MVGRRCTLSLSLAAPISPSLGGLTAIGETAVSVPSKTTVNFLLSRVSPLIVDIVKPLHLEAMKKGGNLKPAEINPDGSGAARSPRRARAQDRFPWCG